MIQASASMTERWVNLVQALAQAEVDTRRIMSILQAIKAAGALHAEIWCNNSRRGLKWTLSHCLRVEGPRRFGARSAAIAQNIANAVSPSYSRYT